MSESTIEPELMEPAEAIDLAAAVEESPEAIPPMEEPQDGLSPEDKGQEDDALENEGHEERRQVGEPEDVDEMDGQSAEGSSEEVSSELPESTPNASGKIPSKGARFNNQKDQEEPELTKEPRPSKESAEEERKEAESTVQKMKVPVAEIKSTRKIIKDTSPQSNRATPNPTKAQQMLRTRVQSCLAYYLFRPESVAKRSPWAVMHAMLPYGVEGELIAGNQRVNAIGWMCYNGKCRTQQLFVPRGNSFTMAVGPGVQGHEGQFLAMLAQSYVPSSYPVQFNGKSFTVGDVIRYEMSGCKEKSELTFKLIGLSHYLPSDQTWQSSDRKTWSISKLVEEELAQPIVGAACGGTHRLMGLTYAVQRREEQGLPIDENFFESEEVRRRFR